MRESFEAHLSVDKSIVELLSKSTYQRNFSYALREMVSNAYDADATKVSISIGPKSQNIVIEDNGSGMTREDFDYYLRIAGKKRGKLKTEKFGRRRIGQFGVGFLSIFPFCKTIKITTTTAKSAEILTAQIPADQFFRGGEILNVDAVTVKGVLYEDPARTADHFTTIELSGLTDFAKDAISTSEPEARGRRSLSVFDWAPLDRLKWELQDELPLAFASESPYRSCFEYAESQLIEVFFNGEQLFRNDINGDVLAKGVLDLENVKCQYAISTAWKAIAPIEMRHVKLRLNNVGVGSRTDFDIARVRPYSRLAWITGELHIVEGLSESISVSRDTFIDSPLIQMLRSQISTVIRKQATFVENVEESRKTISRQVQHGKQVPVAPTRDVIERNIQRLKDKGFQVEKVSISAHSKTEPVSVDRSRKVVRVVENHPAFDDQIKLGKKNYKLIYSQESHTAGVPCALQKDGSIIVYTKFPLFHSKRYGEIFKKFCILSLIAKEKSLSADEMHQVILAELLPLFHEYE